MLLSTTVLSYTSGTSATSASGNTSDIYQYLSAVIVLLVVQYNVMMVDR